MRNLAVLLGWLWQGPASAARLTPPAVDKLPLRSSGPESGGVTMARRLAGMRTVCRPLRALATALRLWPAVARRWLNAGRGRGRNRGSSPVPQPTRHPTRNNPGTGTGSHPYAASEPPAPGRGRPNSGGPRRAHDPANGTSRREHVREPPKCIHRRSADRIERHRRRHRHFPGHHPTELTVRHHAPP